MNLSEAQHELAHYPTFDAFFTRELKPGSRPIDSTVSLVSPADGQLTSFGSFTDGKLIQAKGVFYPVTLFLNTHPQPLSVPKRGAESVDFTSGSVATIYLSPKDCHRVFSPADGEVVSITIIPGALVPVREPYVSTVPELFGRNERMVIMMKTSQGRLAVVMVGALNVGTMTTPLSPKMVTHQWGQKTRTISFESPKKVSKGDLLGIFHMGSTVVLVSDYELKFLAKSGSIMMGSPLAS
jgi:phosphatidylserine decarboxylase